MSDKNEILKKQMQDISDEVALKKKEIEILLLYIEHLEKDYYDLADQMTKQ